MIERRIDHVRRSNALGETMEEFLNTKALVVGQEVYIFCRKKR
jgi:hypothetical protein